MPKGPNTKKLSRQQALETRLKFADEALRKRMEIQRRQSGGRPKTVMNSTIDPSSVGTTLIVGKG